MNNLDGKVCIVTGSTSGIGLITAKELAKMGATTIIVARDEVRGKKALAEVKKASGSNSIELLMCDFSSQSSILAFVEAFKNKYDRLDVLINNAGMMSHKRGEADSGIELTFAVNHLGYFITTNLLLDMLIETPKSRIIVVASDLHFRGEVDVTNLMSKRSYNGFTAYCDSKLANILFTYKIADVLKGTDTTINALHPGVIKTKFSIEDRNSNMTFSMGLLSPEEGAKPQIFLSTSPDVEQISGKYFNRMSVERSSIISYDKNLSDTLWKKSIEFCSDTVLNSCFLFRK